MFNFVRIRGLIGDALKVFRYSVVRPFKLTSEQASERAEGIICNQDVI
jgi:hypothetical protein